ncbi:MAG: Ribosomal protein C-terminal domain, partial [Candidatus Parcubacteria bacterium]
HHLVVDISVLANVGDHVLAKDIKLPASAALKIDADEIVASVTEVVEEKAETPAAPATEAAAAPEAKQE